MKLIIIILLFATVSCQIIFAQEHDSAKFLNIYDQDTIYLHNDYLGKWYVKNGQIMPLGRFGKNLRNEMNNSKYAIEEMDKSRSYAKIGALTGSIAGAIGITRVVFEIVDLEYPYRKERIFL